MEPIARTPKQIGAEIRRYRRRKKLSQTELAAKTKLRQATISTLEKGQTGTQLRTLIDILAALELELVIRPRSSASKKIEDLF